MTFASGCLITSTNKISYSKILVDFCDPASDKLLSLLNHEKIVFSAKILQRGLAKENIDEHTELKDTDTDLALLMLDNKTPNMTKDQYFNPKFDFVSSKPGDIPINSNLYLVGYNGELLEQKDLATYRYLEDFNNTTIYQLNRCHHVNYKCNKYVSINSHQFQTFIGETILPNIKNDK
ncbi:unnamed protein product, partial [Rotaria sordida]